VPEIIYLLLKDAALIFLCKGILEMLSEESIMPRTVA